MRVHVMRVARGLAAGILVVSGSVEAGVVAQAAAPGNGWGKAIEVPGTASLNIGGIATVSSVSCTSGGYCAAVGNYGSIQDDPHVTQGFVVSRQNGRWGTAQKVQGLDKFRALFSQLDSVSCASPGNCTAGGFYLGFEADQFAFVVSERNGKWGNAVPVANALNQAGFAEVYSVSCPSVGNCSAAGFYGGGPDSFSAQPFVISQHNGQWGSAIEVPGTAVLNVDNAGRANSISCPSAGNCEVGGFYTDADGQWQAFVASQRKGAWHDAIEVPGTAPVNLGGNARIVSVSCSALGNCAAGGFYEASVFDVDRQEAKWQAFVVNERNGTWGNAVPVLPTASINDNLPGAGVESVSCPSTGSCTASGYFRDPSGRGEAFIVSQRKGKWGTAATVKGTGALNTGDQADALSVSCPSAGNCAAGGYYSGSQHHAQAFVASERNGRWAKATEVPGFGRLNVGGDGTVYSVSCAATGRCSAGGIYRSHGKHQAFVVSQTGR